MARKQRPKKGTEYTPRDTEQRSYFLPPGLGDTFRDFCTAGHGGASAGARGALVLFMACEDFPALREKAVRAADRLDPKAAIKEIKAALLDILGQELMYQYIQSLPPKEKTSLMKEALDKRR